MNVMEEKEIKLSLNSLEISELLSFVNDAVKKYEKGTKPYEDGLHTLNQKLKNKLVFAWTEACEQNKTKQG